MYHVKLTNFHLLKFLKLLKGFKLMLLEFPAAETVFAVTETASAKRNRCHPAIQNARKSAHHSVPAPKPLEWRSPTTISANVHDDGCCGWELLDEIDSAPHRRAGQIPAYVYRQLVLRQSIDRHDRITEDQLFL